MECDGDDVVEDFGDSRGLFCGFDDDGVSGDECSDGHSAGDCEWEVPGGDDDGDAFGLVPEFVEFSDEPSEAFGCEEFWGGACVVGAEVDCFADIGVCFVPCFACFFADDSGEFVSSFNHDFCDA